MTRKNAMLVWITGIEKRIFIGKVKEKCLVSGIVKEEAIELDLDKEAA